MKRFLKVLLICFSLTIVCFGSNFKEGLKKYKDKTISVFFKNTPFEAYGSGASVSVINGKLIEILEDCIVMTNRKGREIYIKLDEIAGFKS